MDLHKRFIQCKHSALPLVCRWGEIEQIEQGVAGKLALYSAYAMTNCEAMSTSESAAEARMAFDLLAMKA